MEGRIAALHVRYRAPAYGTIGAALAPALDRAIHARLGEAIADRLDAMLGPDGPVIVIRELTSSVRLGKAEWSLDSRVIDRIGRASADAVVDVLETPGDTDSLVRFEDQAAFVGSFIVDLMDGLAWNRWYYGAFHRYRRADLGATMEAVLTDNAPFAARVFGWLARRGRLAQVLALLQPATTRRLASSGETPPVGAAVPVDFAPLVAAAFDVLRLLGWTLPDAEGRETFVSQYAASSIPPSWTDRRSLSSWFLAFIEYVQMTLDRAGGRRRAGDPEALRRLLAGPLDWLDTAWLGPRLDRLSETPPLGRDLVAEPDRRILDRRDEEALERLASLVTQGQLRLERTADRDVVIVRLLAAIAEEAADGRPPGRAVIAAIERIADAWHAHVTRTDRDADGATPADVAADPRSAHARVEPAAATDAVRAAGPAAVDLLRKLVKSSAARVTGEPTNGGGLFLLIRALLDVRLSVLAREAAVPFDALRGALATEWLGLRPPFDGPASLWIGTPDPDLASLDASRAGLANLEQALVQVLLDQHTIDAWPADETLVDRGALLGNPALSEATSAACSRIAWMVMRCWSRWLPGFAEASSSYLVQNCLRREGEVAVAEGTIAVELAPAPLDIVLEMAGYFRPVERVPWLGDRSVTFTLRPRPSAA